MTANSQPMDQGIIENFKCHYKKILLCRWLEAMDMGKEFEFTLLDALHIVWCAWEQVSKSMIRNCFMKPKFIEEEYQTEPDDAELLKIWEALPAEEKMYQKEEIELSNFLKADDASMQSLRRQDARNPPKEHVPAEILQSFGLS